jgi:hypothetical protein
VNDKNKKNKKDNKTKRSVFFKKTLIKISAKKSHPGYKSYFSIG